ncbi:hypothetical protein K9M47_03435 [Candidatus Gracilibacteria bacterium]|nr:hypothetical protein [Candidatus Gracilibacteria bacterium]
MLNLWPYLLRLAVALYFISPHVQSLMLGANKLNAAIFTCIDEYIPSTVAFTIWHGFFVLIGTLILLWPRPVFPLLIGLIVLSSQLYLNFSVNGPAIDSMLQLVLILVSLALIISHSRPKFK